jgi:hypothetical protein
MSKLQNSLKKWLGISKTHADLQHVLAQQNIQAQQLILLQEALGRLEKRQLQPPKAAYHFQDFEFRTYSQWGEDGLIQFLIDHIVIQHKCFVEFGVENYTQSNTRFLLKNNNWSGLIMDASADNIQFIQHDLLYWQYNLKAIETFITPNNINTLLETHHMTGDIGLLSIDIDGNDYWVWQAITVAQPIIVIAEYNARFGPFDAVTIPYQEDFTRSAAHYSMIYYGASLKALCDLAETKGYDLVGCNSAGNNAFFVRKDYRPDILPAISCEEGYQSYQFRESRDENGELNFMSKEAEQALLKTLPLVTV